MGGGTLAMEGVGDENEWHLFVVVKSLGDCSSGRWRRDREMTKLGSRGGERLVNQIELSLYLLW